LGQLEQLNGRVGKLLDRHSRGRKPDSPKVLNSGEPETESGRVYSKSHVVTVLRCKQLGV
jgi:hypothetical protein